MGYFKTEEAKLRYLIAKKRGAETKSNIYRTTYYSNPNKCTFCGEVIPYEKRRNTFCDSSCAASFNNIGIVRHGVPVKFRPSRYCAYCGTPLNERSKRFCNNSCQHEFERLIRINKWLVTGKASIHSNKQHYIKKYLLASQDDKCAVCGINNVWNSIGLVFVLDHIDGDSYNNVRENLRLVCPNCDSQLPTYKGRNFGNGRYSRRIRYKEGKSY